MVGPVAANDLDADSASEAADLVAITERKLLGARCTNAPGAIFSLADLANFN
jgi:hypothetical protein